MEAPSYRTAFLVGLTAAAAAGVLYLYWQQDQEKGRRGLRKSKKGVVKKPQSRWKVKLADNQPGPFVHLRRPGQDPSEPHPYGPEIRALIDDPSSLLLATATSAPVKTIPSLNEEDYVWVERREQLEALAVELMKVTEFGVDTEQHSQHSFLGYTALLQISTRTCDYVVDTLAVHDHMHLLRAPFSNPQSTKVFHGSDNDIVWLQRDFHIYEVNLFDTYRAAIALEKPQKSLASLLQCYCGVGIDKKFQKSDWRLRPLPEELLEYARTDAHYLVYIADCLRRELLEGKSRNSAIAVQNEAGTRTTRGPLEEAEGSDEEALLSKVELQNGESGKLHQAEESSKAQAISLELYAQVLLRSNALCLQLYEKESSASSSAASLISRHYSTPAGSQMTRQQSPEESFRFRELVRALTEWREKTARSEDESLRAVLTDSALLALALKCPSSESEILDTVKESDLQGTFERNKHVQHQFSEVVQSPSSLLEANISFIRKLISHYASESSVGQQKEPESARNTSPGSGQSYTKSARGNLRGSGQTYARVTRSAQEPSGWARVEDDSLSKKAHPAKQHRDPVAARARFVSKFACKKTVYENCRIYAGDGRLLCYCDRKKLDWYVQKDLADFCGDDPPSITLKFEPKGRPEDENNEFYISSKSNRCVACGETSHYLRFRLVPSCYRQHFPEHLKSHRSHDIVLLCVDCHEVAHKATERHKKLVSRKYGVPLIPAKVNGTTEEGSSGSEGVDPDGLRRAATALIMHGSVMPKERVEELQRIVKEYYGKDELTPQDLMEARLTGMGPKGQRRVYKKKGTKIDGQETKALCTADERHVTESEDKNGRHESASEEETDGSDEGPADENGHFSHRLETDESSHIDKSNHKPAAENVNWDLSEDAESANRHPGEDAESVNRHPGEDAESVNRHQGEDAESVNRHLSEDSEGAHLRSRKSGILSRRQRHKLRAQQVEDDIIAGGGPREKGRKAEAVLGHGQHGKRVVEILEERGGEDALREFVQEWRACFVEALRPNYLPSAWDVKHSGKREFGEFSVYKPKAEDLEEGDHEHSKELEA